MEIIAFVVLFFIWGHLAAEGQRKKDIAKAWEDAHKFDPPNIHGKAHWATDAELKAAGMFRNSGMPLAYSRESGKEIFLPEKECTSMVSFGGAGSGKTTSALIPVALSFPGSLIYSDGTGEGGAVTAHYRRRFGKVYQTNPSGYMSGPMKGVENVGFNPIGPRWLNPKDKATFGPRALKIAEAVVRHESHQEPYWYSTAIMLVQVISMFLAENDPKNCHLGKVAEIIAGDVQDYIRFIFAKSSNHFVRLKCARFTTTKEIRSMSEVFENTRTETAFLLDDGTYDTLKRDQLFTGDMKKFIMSWYPVMPPSETDGKFLALCVGVGFSTLLRTESRRDKRTLIIADEYHAMGFHKGHEIFATARKHKVQLWMCLQDYSQLVDLNGPTASTVINNAGVVQVIAASDVQGSEYLSSLSGEMEVYSRSKSVSPDLQSEMPVVSNNITQVQRKLILPGELRSMAADDQILFVKGLDQPILCKKKPYFRTLRRFLARSNPYYRGGFFRKIFGR